MLVLKLKRPALISVMQGTPRASSFMSMQNTPDAFGSMLKIALLHTSVTRGSYTVLERAATEDTALA